MPNSFVANVNHIASLDTQYGFSLSLSKNNILLPGGFVYTFTADIEVYNRRTMVTEITTATGASAQLLLLDIKTKIESLYATSTVVEEVTSIGTGSIGISLSASLPTTNLDYYFKLITINITSNGVSKYIIKSTTSNNIEMIPRMVTITPATVAGMLPVLDHIHDISVVATDFASVSTVAADIANINTVVNNMPGIVALNTNIADIVSANANIADISAVATNIANVSAVAANAAAIDAVLLNVVPNIAEILLSGSNASTATAGAVSATASAVSANASANAAETSNLASASNLAGSLTNKNAAAASATAASTSATTSAGSASSSEASRLASVAAASASEASKLASASSASDSAFSAAASGVSANAAEASNLASASNASAASASATQSAASAVTSAASASASAGSASASNLSAVDSAASALTAASSASAGSASALAASGSASAASASAVASELSAVASDASSLSSASGAAASLASATASAASAATSTASATSAHSSDLSSASYASQASASALSASDANAASLANKNATDISSAASAASALASSNSAVASNAAYLDSEAARASSQLSATEALASKNTASTHAGNALASETAAAASSASALASATASAASNILSNAWAEAAHNLPVSGTIGVDAKYSSYHWAIEASTSTVSDILRDDLTTLTTSWSSSKLAPMISGKADAAHDHALTYEPILGAHGTAFNKDFAGSGTATTVAKSDHTHSGVYEPEIAVKNTGFNKPIGTTSLDVAAGDHTHTSLYMPKETILSAYNKNFVVDSSAPLATEVARGNHSHLATGISYNPTGNRLVTSTNLQGAIAQLDSAASTFTTAEKCYMTADLTDPSYVVDIVTQDVPVPVYAGMTILSSNNSLYSNGIIIDYAVAPTKLIQGEFFSTITIGMIANTKFSLIPLINGVVATQFNIGSSVGSNTSSLVGNVQISANGFISGLNNGDVISLAIVNNSSNVDATIYGMTMSFAGQPEGAVVASGISISHNDTTNKDAAAQHPTSSIYDLASGTALNTLLDQKAFLVPAATLDNLVSMDASGATVNSGIAKSTITGKMDKVALPVSDTIVVMDATGNSKKGSALISDLALKGGSTANKFLVMDATLGTEAVSKSQLDGLSTVYSTIATMSAHTAAANPHNVTPALIGAATTVHGHAIADVSNLQAALDAKYLKVTTPVTGNLVVFEAGGLLKDGGAPYAHPAGDGFLHVPATSTTNNGKVLTAGATAGSLSWTTASTGTVTSVTAVAPIVVATGTTTPSISMAAATAIANGYMTSTYASKLDGIAAGAQVNVATNITATAGTTSGPVINSSTGTGVTLPSASGTESGIITTGTQTIAGVKTLTNANLVTPTIGAASGTSLTLTGGASASISVNGIDILNEIKMMQFALMGV